MCRPKKKNVKINNLKKKEFDFNQPLPPIPIETDCLYLPKSPIFPVIINNINVPSKILLQCVDTRLNVPYTEQPPPLPPRINKRSDQYIFSI